LQIADELADFCKALGVPFGFNIESVAIRKEEIEASIAMVSKISEMLVEKGIRKHYHGIAQHQIMPQTPDALVK
jgi:hypothetical protein